MESLPALHRSLKHSDNPLYHLLKDAIQREPRMLALVKADTGEVPELRRRKAATLSKTDARLINLSEISLPLVLSGER